MADPHKILAPIVEPPLPPVPVVSPDPLWLAPGFWVALSATVVLLILGVWLWRRGAAGREVRRIACMEDPVMAADALAQWVRVRNAQPSPGWQNALDRVRFGPVVEGQAQTMARLCLEAITFVKPR